MSDVDAAFERLKRLSETQASYAAREVSAYITNEYEEIHFGSPRSLDELASLISALPHERRDEMVEAVQALAERFEYVNEVRARISKIRLTEPGRYFLTTYDPEQFPKDWPEREYAEVFDDCVVRKVWRMRDGALQKDSIDGSWNESVASLDEPAPCVGRTGVSVVEVLAKDQFEQVWSEAKFIYKEGDQTWELFDTTAPTDPSFEPVLGVWVAADGAGDTIEFTLNGIVLLSAPGAPLRFFGYSVEGVEVRLDPGPGTNILGMVLQSGGLIDEKGRQFRRED